MNTPQAENAFTKTIEFLSRSNRNTDGNGAVISSSRAIIYSYKAERPEDWESLSKRTMKEIIEAKAIQARDELNGIR